MPSRSTYWLMLAFCLLAGIASHPATVAAQQTGVQPEELEGLGIEEHLGETVPGDLVFLDEAGQAVRLDTYFDGEKPVILNFVYHSCPMICNLVLDMFTGTMQEMDWVPGSEFRVLTVSFNAIETPELAQRQKERYLKMLDKPDAASGWHFLTGDSTAIAALTGATGYAFRWVEETQEFAHPSALIFLDGNGKIMRYLYGLDFPARDVRTALVEASEGKVGTTIDRFVLFCFRYDPTANSYVPDAINLMKAGGVLTMLILGAFLFVMWRREVRKQGHRAPAFS